MGRLQSAMLGGALGMLFGVVLFAYLAKLDADLARTRWQAECIARGVAEYDAKTGEWKWTVEKESEPK